MTTARLKPLPTNLKYAFLEENKHLLIIVGVGLSVEEEEKLIGILEANKKALGWSVEDIHGINPTVV
jgi:hypothetical protein